MEDSILVGPCDLRLLSTVHIQGEYQLRPVNQMSLVAYEAATRAQLFLHIQLSGLAYELRDSKRG